MFDNYKSDELYYQIIETLKKDIGRMFFSEYNSKENDEVRNRLRTVATTAMCGVDIRALERMGRMVSSGPQQLAVINRLNSYIMTLRLKVPAAVDRRFVKRTEIMLSRFNDITRREAGELLEAFPALLMVPFIQQAWHDESLSSSSR